ncbi:SDR family oxidoreductase [Nitrospinota bacterium]
MKNVLVIGATSVIANETAKLIASERGNFFLVGRNEEKLKSVADDLKVRGAPKADIFVMDLNDCDGHSKLVDGALKSLSRFDIVLIAHGTLPDQTSCALNPTETIQALHTNAISTISLLTHIANQMEKQKDGCIAVLSSPAGDRGRKSNYIYGSAKSAVSTFLEGLRNRLHESNVHVLTVKPGFVDTPMTKNMQKGLLWVGPDVIASGIWEAIRKKRSVVYLPWFWKYIMFMIKCIPESIFVRLSL